MILWSK